MLAVGDAGAVSSPHGAGTGVGLLNRGGELGVVRTDILGEQDGIGLIERIAGPSVNQRSSLGGILS